MKINKIALIGSTGYIGQEIVKTLIDTVYCILQIDKQSTQEILHLDLNHPERFNYKQLSECQFVIFTAAISGPDFCATNYEESYLINVTGTKYFINKAFEQNCKVLFFSSDAVYGKDEKIFDESSQTNAFTAYGMMKKEVEDCFKNHPNFKAIRLSYVFSENDKFTRYLYSCLKSNQEVEIFHPFYRNVVMLNDLLYVINWLITNWDSFQNTFLNICGKELVSRIQMVDEFNRFNNPKIQYKIKIPEKEFFMNRPEITEVRSLYLGAILENYSEPFSSKIRTQLLSKKI